MLQFERRFHAGAECQHFASGFLRQLHQEGQTIVMITHEHAVAERAKRILYIYDGWLREEERV